MDAVLARLPAAGSRPEVACRMAGDAFVLLEYGPLAFDLTLNLYARGVAGSIEAARIPGVTDLAPGVRSLLVGFDPHVTELTDLVDRLIGLHVDSGPETVTRTGRRITLPLAFDDSSTREAITRHRSTGATEGYTASSDIDDIVAASGLGSPADVLAAATGQRWCVAFIGYFPGLPFLLPMDGAPVLRVPKLDRLRAWTAEGAVSLGGACVAIFPVEAPGSYRVFGRTVPIYAWGSAIDAFDGDRMLLRAGDVVRFVAVEEDELTEARRQAYENRYDYLIEEPIGPPS
ncbi:MAG: 5-oxoprolinase subunit B family protein [Nocardioidaceae bacterium]